MVLTILRELGANLWTGMIVLLNVADLDDAAVPLHQPGSSHAMVLCRAACSMQPCCSMGAGASPGLCYESSRPSLKAHKLRPW